MPSMVDHVADKNGAELARLSKLYDFPSFVKQANMEQTFNPGQLAVTVYADPRSRQFPCHTAASTWLSALYFQEKRAEFHPKDQGRIEQRIDHYASYFRIKRAVDLMRQRWSELHKSADDKLPDSAYAYVWTGDNGHKERRLPLRNAMEVKVAAEWLHTYCDRVPFSDRHTIATKIVQKAIQFGAGLGKYAEFIEKQAGRGVCDPDEVVQMIRGRAAFVRNPGLKQHFFKMAQTVQEMPRKALLPDMLVKLAETIDQLDRNLGLVGKYSDGLPRPEDVLFKSTFGKAASDLAATVATTSGKVYEKTAFKKLSVDDVRSLFGDEFVERVTTRLGDIDPEKFAEEVATLPRPDAEMLDGLMSDAGISPIMAKAASVRYGLSKEEMAAWANAYQSVG